MYFCDNLYGRENNDVNSIYCVQSAKHWVKSMRADTGVIQLYRMCMREESLVRLVCEGSQL